MTSQDPPHPPVPEYEIRVAGHLSPRWRAWFDGLTVTTDVDGTTVLRGPVIDQAALHGLLQKLRDMGIPLVSLHRVPSNPVTEPPARPTNHEPPARAITNEPPARPITNEPPARPMNKEN